MRERRHNVTVKTRGARHETWPLGSTCEVRAWAEDFYEGAGLLITLPDGSQLSVELTPAIVRELHEDCETVRVKQEARVL